MWKIIIYKMTYVFTYQYKLETKRLMFIHLYKCILLFKEIRNKYIWYNSIYIKTKQYLFYMNICACICLYDIWKTVTLKLV